MKKDDIKILIICIVLPSVVIAVWGLTLVLIQYVRLEWF